VPVGRADEVDVSHPVPAHVVEEGSLPLDEALVLLARDRLSDEALLQRRRRLLDDRHFLAPADTTASTMFTYPVQRQMLP
jgi:hypothetical protein